MERYKKEKELYGSTEDQWGNEVVLTWNAFHACLADGSNTWECPGVTEINGKVFEVSVFWNFDEYEADIDADCYDWDKDPLEVIVEGEIEE